MCCVSVYVRVHSCLYVYTRMCMCMCICVYMCTYACVFASACVYVFVCPWVFICVRIASNHLLPCLRQDLLFAAVSSRLVATCPSGDSLLSSSRVVETVGLQMCATMSGLTRLLGIQSDPHACPVKFQVPIELPAQPVLSTPTVTLLSFSEAPERQNQLSSSSWPIWLSWDWKRCGRWKILLLVHFRFLLPLQNLAFNGGVQGYKSSLPVSATSSF